MIPDTLFAKERLKAFLEIPWPISALTLMDVTDEDLDNLAAATKDEYWSVLNRIVTRIESEAA